MKVDQSGKKTEHHCKPTIDAASAITDTELLMDLTPLISGSSWGPHSYNFSNNSKLFKREFQIFKQLS